MPRSWIRELRCKGCGAAMGHVSPPDAYKRTTRHQSAEKYLRTAADQAVCERCSGADRSRRKENRRLELQRGALTQDGRARTVVCPLKRCAAPIGQDCRPVDGALLAGSWVHARRIDAAYAALKAAVHTLGRKYNAEHDQAARVVYLAEALELAVKRPAPVVDVDAVGLVVRYGRRSAPPPDPRQLALFP